MLNKINYNVNNSILLQLIIIIIIIILFYVINSYLSKKNIYYNKINNNKQYEKEKFNNYQTINNKNVTSLNEYILPRVVYGYWDNLEDNDIIQAHVNTWTRKLAPGWNAVIITRKTVHNYVDPDFLQKYQNIGAVRFSDFLRVYLLSKNGGVWMDAGTILIDGQFLKDYRNEMIENKIDALIYEFKSHSKPGHPYLENWFLMAPKGSLFITDLYNEFSKAYDMDFVKYKYDVLSSKISFENTMGEGENTYHLQHGIIQYLLKENPGRYNMSIKDADESMFKAQKINDWNSDKLIRYIIDNNDWNDYYAIKLVNFNRKPIESCKEEFINKLNNM
jgi:hypothetical protein